MSETFQSRRSSIYHKSPGNEDGIDFLSNMPDSIICEIISKLETREAVQTSLLSSRYKSLWMYITSLSFTYKDCRCDGIKFTHFVNMVLVLLKSKSINEFCLRVVTPFPLYDIPTWFSAAIDMNVKVLKLHILPEFWIEKDDGVFMPACLYTSKTLELLELCNKPRGHLSLDVPEFVSLPKLTTLRLDYVDYSSDESVRRLISGCSSLENLTIERDRFDGMPTFTIDSPTLKTLDCSIEFYPIIHNEDFEFELKAPALREFYLSDNGSRGFSVFNLCSLEFAEINVASSKGDNIDSHYEKVVQLLQGLHNVNHLWISGDTLEALSHGPSDESDFRRSIFGMYTNYPEQSILQDLLDPSTQSHDWYLSKDSSDTTHVVQWCQPLELPVCLLSCLKTISVIGFKGRESELSMIAYILKNATVLKNIRIGQATSEAAANFELREKILKFDQGSERCEIIFY